MKHLYLVRHAKSSWSDETLGDRDRPLNRRGRRQVAAIAAPLLKLGALDGPVYASGACRARETIEGLMEQLPGENLAQRVHLRDDLYTFEASDLLKWLALHGKLGHSITIIGHNPALLELARHLAGDAPKRLPTGGALHLELPTNSWKKIRKHSGKVLNQLTPKVASYTLFKRKAPAPPVIHNPSLKSRIPLVLEYQYRLIRALEAGVKAGHDPEFLHQYRINIRRSRAIAESLVEITGDKTLKKTVKVLKRRGQATSQSRDLDVFLGVLSRQQQDPSGAEALRQGRVMTFFRIRAHDEHRHLSDQMHTRAYRDDLTQWRSLITSDKFRNLLGHLGSDAVQGVLEQRINQHNTLLRQLSSTSPDGEVHKLRKLVKRIRYLAELDKAAFGATLKQLKKRQEMLGHFQDLCVQINFLDEFSRSYLAAAVPEEAMKQLEVISRQWRSEKQQTLDQIRMLEVITAG
ncbi:CHAD domain-containing protein [Marinobacter changyiensis]|uniref:CHAD domain-containing protein n=1 Tax=Marinobacter changyiensis TaxID=2604091 RepID=UPI001264743D|nr:CHAD domain-containing protein [Marinobacter changyiensis]